jgi:hypothetical protein
MSARVTGVRVLVVANRTASMPMLLDEVSRRAREGARFTLVIPPEHAAHGGEDWSVADATRLLERAAGEPVEHLDSGPDVFDAIHRAVEDRTCDEIILSTPTAHLSRWIHHDLRHRVEHLKLPVRVIPPAPDAPLPDDMRRHLPESWSHPPLPGAGGGSGAF